jgi:hypothetical protein
MKSEPMFYKEGTLKGFRFGKIFNRYIIDFSISKDYHSLEDRFNPLFDFGFCFAKDDFFILHVGLFGVSSWFRLSGTDYDTGEW